jgi:2,4-didehydro-3-deoxy-L-rhamnonate hydrolase
MAMRIARITITNSVKWVVESGDALRALSGDYPTTRAFFENGGIEDATAAMAKGAIVTGDISFLSPVTHDSRFICQATNYADHIRETGGNPAHVKNNILFTKASSCIVPADADIVRPAHVKLLDYEVELGLVMKRGFSFAEQITAGTISDWIGALVIVNDITARDVQISHMQFHKSKSYRTFGPVGPWLVIPSTDEWARLFELQLTLRVDGKVRQREFAKEMIFKPHQTLTELSQIMDVHPGDLIATGTPAGVALHPPSAFIQALAGFLSPAKRFGAFMKGQLKRDAYLQPGQYIQATIATEDGAINLGEQNNRIVQG